MKFKGKEKNIRDSDTTGTIIKDTVVMLIYSFLSEVKSPNWKKKKHYWWRWEKREEEINQKKKEITLLMEKKRNKKRLGEK